MEEHKYSLDLIQGLADRTIHRMFIIIIVLLCIIVLLVGGLVWLWTSCDFISTEYTQDGEGLNIIGDRNVGGVFDGTAFESADGTG